jgi:sugar phosphate isomerase/epimerase
VTTGLVSNCWQKQLDSGADLLDLITQAVRTGCSCVELRQTCLGRFERDEPPVPDASALRELPEAFPDVVFNVAINVPFLQAENVETTPVFAAAVDAAQAVAGDHRPHLRLVDLTTSAEQLANGQMDEVSRNVVRLTKLMIERDGWLSIEHSLQPWQPFLGVFRDARRLLGERADNLRLCFDPVNLLFGDTDLDPGDVTRSLSAHEISMVHFKQRRNGEVLTRMDDGDVDWREQISLLKSAGYRGPYLFEIRSTDDVWTELATSGEYLQTCGFTAESC